MLRLLASLPGETLAAVEGRAAWLLRATLVLTQLLQAGVLSLTATEDETAPLAAAKGTNAAASSLPSPEATKVATEEYQLGRAAFESGDFEKAEPHFIKAASVAPHGEACVARIRGRRWRGGRGLCGGGGGECVRGVRAVVSRAESHCEG